MPSVLLDSARVYLHPRLSPDGRRVAFEVASIGSNEIWIADLASGTFERLTREGFNDRPEWRPDGSRLLFSSSRSRANELWWQPADGSGPAELVYQGPEAIREGVFTPDGNGIVFRTDTPDSNRDIFRLPLAGERVPVPLLIGIERRQASARLARLEAARLYLQSVGSRGGVCPGAVGQGGEGPDLHRWRW